MRIIYKILTILLLIPTLCIVFIIGGVSLIEGYNIFNPYIDTEFAPDYIPEKFDQISYEDSKQDVIRKIGKPLFGYDESNSQGGTFDYTNDGYLRRKSKKEYFINDFAWYRSSVTFDSLGKVIYIDKGWSYD